MDGFSDLPYRTLAREFGSALSYTEFISCIDVLNESPKVTPLIKFNEDERPVVFQIYDADPERMLEAALILQEFKPDIIDVNLGCSAQAIVKRGAGSALLKTPKKIALIFNNLSTNLDVPVTGKIRLGWDQDSKNYLDVAKIIEDNGGQLLAVHARTKAQGLRGAADWGAIAEIKNKLNIPVVGNGGIDTIEDIDKMLSETGCDAVMIGRAAMGNPWIFAGKDRENISADDVLKVILEHLNRMRLFYDAPFSLIRFRKHLKPYLKPFNLKKESSSNLLTSEDSNEFISIIKETLTNINQHVLE